MPPDHRLRLSLSRTRVREAGADGFLVPLTDEHMSEYVGAYAQRLRWLTGFTGSAGLAVVLAGRAALFVDGRYTIQARAETDAEGMEVQSLHGEALADWLNANAPDQGVVLYDPWLHTRAGLEKTASALTRGLRLRPASANLVDAIWSDRPAPSAAAVEIQPLSLTGRSSRAKRLAIAERVQALGADAVVIPALESIAWTLNIRGQDVAYTPVVRSFLVVEADASARFYVDGAKLSAGVTAHLGDDVQVRPYTAISADLADLAGRAVMVDPETCVAGLLDALTGSRLIASPDPSLLLRAIKSPAEIAGMRAAHRRDGVALTRFLHWIAHIDLAAPPDEIEASDALEAMRREAPQLRGLSFATISASGPNGALPHYVAKPGSARRLEVGSLYLVDSGGQYGDGTTDVTRTVAIGAPSAEMRRHFTLVLKGHLAIAAARLPPGATGAQLDPLARQPLWQAGLDYPTGTGHGVGSYLSVHEGPCFIGRRGGTRPVDEPLRANMVLTNEPGLYLEGRYGIRTENLMLIVERTGHGGEAGWLGFETLTLAPIDRALIDLALLTAEERAWIDDYHARVARTLAPDLDPTVRDWLQQVCSPL